jgi:hypothetical protein
VIAGPRDPAGAVQPRNLMSALRAYTSRPRSGRRRVNRRKRQHRHLRIVREVLRETPVLPSRRELRQLADFRALRVVPILLIWVGQDSMWGLPTASVSEALFQPGFGTHATILICGMGQLRRKAICGKSQMSF